MINGSSPHDPERSALASAGLEQGLDDLDAASGGGLHEGGVADLARAVDRRAA